MSMAAVRAAIIVLHAPRGTGAAMLPEEQNPATDLSVIVRRATVLPLSSPPLPAPLGDLVAEYRVDKCTALSSDTQLPQITAPRS